MKDSTNQVVRTLDLSTRAHPHFASFLKTSPVLRFSFADTSSLQRGILKLHQQEESKDRAQPVSDESLNE